jgi:hypothetical protein
MPIYQYFNIWKNEKYFETFVKEKQPNKKINMEKSPVKNRIGLEDWAKSKDVMVQYGWRNTKMWRLIKEGAFITAKIGSERWIKLSSIQAYLEKNAK